MTEPNDDLAPDAETAPTPSDASSSKSKARTLRQFYEALTAEVAKVYVGQKEFVQGTLVALLSGGHVLIESVPGLGKTLLCRVLAKTLGCKFGRIQFTADLMPSDITGAPVFDMREQKFQFRPGPIFTQILLADEINRSPAKTHAALLEVMQERRVTVDGVTYPVERPFIVLATQNPIESEGTYNLPEAQLDRFMFKVVVNYPSEKEESDILRLHRDTEGGEDQLVETVVPVANAATILAALRACGSVRVDDKVVEYIGAIVRKSRDWPAFYVGASPRAGIALLKASRTLAAMSGRDYVTPDDVVELVLPAMRHRVILAPEAEVEGQTIDASLQELVRTIEVPRL